MNEAIRLPEEDAFIEGVLVRRCLAWLIDVAVIGVILAVLWVILFLFGLVTFGLGFGAMAILPGVPFLYHLGSLLRASSATPGQSFMRLTVRRDSDLGPPDIVQALVFTALFYVTLATAGLLLLITPFTVRHRTFHDMLSGLVVVRRGAFETWARG